MRILILFAIVLMLVFSVAAQNQKPNLNRSEDLNALGIGKIVEKDRSVIKNITLYEVKEYWIVFAKDGSVHDLMMEQIDRIEFNNSKWGAIKIEFPGGKLKISEI